MFNAMPFKVSKLKLLFVSLLCSMSAAAQLFSDSNESLSTIQETWIEYGFLLETPHPYVVRDVFNVPIKIEGARKLKLFFPRIETEAGYDYLQIYDGTGAMVHKFAGKKIDFMSPEIDGDLAVVELKQDNTGVAWGLALTKIFVLY